MLLDGEGQYDSRSFQGKRFNLLKLQSTQLYYNRKEQAMALYTEPVSKA